MVHTWLLRRGLRKILSVFILVLIGLIVFTHLMAQPIEINHTIRPVGLVGIPIELRIRFIIEVRARIGASIGAIGIVSAIVGIGYLLATVILEYTKKKRYANRSKIRVSSKMKQTLLNISFSKYEEATKSNAILLLNTILLHLEPI